MASSDAISNQPFINPVVYPSPRSLQGWIDSNRGLLRPPVGNALMYGTGSEFKVMVVGGPNVRTDYHIEEGEEWFYQMQGDMTLKVVDNGHFKDIHIKEGETFLLPPRVPHSPQRFKNTIGLVIERERREGEWDKLRYYCPNTACREELYTFTFQCSDLGTQLKPIIEQWYSESEEWKQKRTCKKCGARDQKPEVN